MLSHKSVDLNENNCKRKPEGDKSTAPPPPNKLPRLETNPKQEKEAGENSFNTYQYWKNPLPDISLELDCLECKRFSN